MKPVQQPVGQVRLTNVAIVRYKKMGKRYEIAAYKNKVVNWRNRIETDINEVLQTHTVFHNVSKGIVAGKADLMNVFETDDHLSCAKIILDKGELEVSDKERAMQYDTLFRDIATTIAEKCINPHTSRPYPLSLIERSLHEIHYAVIPTKSAKAQALKAINALKAYIPIERARMKVRITVPTEYAKGVPSSSSSSFSSSTTASSDPSDSSSSTSHSTPYLSLKTYLLNMHAIIEYENTKAGPNGTDTTYEAIIDPGYFRRIEDEGKKLFGGGNNNNNNNNNGDGSSSSSSSSSLCQVEVLSLSVIQDNTGTTGSSGTSSDSTTKTNTVNTSNDDNDNDDDTNSDNDTIPSSTATVTSSSTANLSSSVQALSLNPSVTTNNAMDAATLASAKGTGMMVRRVVQPGTRRLTCNACSIDFTTPEEHREHHRSDLHRFNLKRKVKNLEPLTIDAFEAMPAKQRDAFLQADI